MRRTSANALLVPGGDPRDVTVVFVRHGQTAATEGDRYGPPLSALGRRQAQRVSVRLKGCIFRRIYASDLARAQETASAIRARHPRTPFTLDRRIREVESHHFGRDPLPRGPGLRDALRLERRRVEAFCRRLVDTSRAGDQVLVVAHGNLIRLVVALLCRVDPRQQAFFRTYNTSITVLTFRAGGKSGHKIILADCVRHLPPDEITNWTETGTGK